MVPFDVVSGRSWMISNSGGVSNVSESFEELRLRLSETLILSYFVTVTSEDEYRSIRNVKFNIPCETYLLCL